MKPKSVKQSCISNSKNTNSKEKKGKSEKDKPCLTFDSKHSRDLYLKQERANHLKLENNGHVSSVATKLKETEFHMKPSKETEFHMKSSSSLTSSCEISTQTSNDEKVVDLRSMSGINHRAIKRPRGTRGLAKGKNPPLPVNGNKVELRLADHIIIKDDDATPKFSNTHFSDHCTFSSDYNIDSEFAKFEKSLNSPVSEPRMVETNINVPKPQRTDRSSSSFYSEATGYDSQFERTERQNRAYYTRLKIQALNDKLGYSYFPITNYGSYKESSMTPPLSP